MTQHNNDPFNISLPGFKTFLDDTGNFNIIMSPNELPFEQGIAVYEIKGEFNLSGLILNQDQLGKHSCFSEIRLESSFNSFSLSKGIETGDTLIQLDDIEQYDLRIMGLDFNVILIPNQNGRLGSFKIEIPDIGVEFDEAKEIMFQTINYIVNLISISYGLPVRAASFYICYDVINLFSIIEAKPKSKNSLQKLFKINNIRSDIGKWDIALNHYRRALLNQDPQSKFLSLFIGCEMLRSIIKDEIGIDESIRYIKGNGYKEPVITGSYEYNNAKLVFPNIKGKSYASVLFGIFKDLRNASAHHMLDNGTYKNPSSLNDYIEFYSTVPYLLEIFDGYLTELLKLTCRYKSHRL